MCLKKILTVIIFILFYQTHLYSKSNSFNNFNPKNLSDYFSGIVAFENKKNSEALNFYNSSKILINQHDPYLKRYVTSLVLENKVSQATLMKIRKVVYESAPPKLRFWPKWGYVRLYPIKMHWRRVRKVISTWWSSTRHLFPGGHTMGPPGGDMEMWLICKTDYADILVYILWSKFWKNYFVENG